MPDNIICTVDIVMLTLKDDLLQVVLSHRDHAPYAMQTALPGGYIQTHTDTDTFHAAERVLKQKTGIISPYLEQLAVFSGMARDPRGWSISIAYYALVPLHMLAQRDTATLILHPVDTLEKLPFDHNRIIDAALQRVRNQSSYSSLPVYLCGEEFTLPQLQRVYETLLGESINKVSFRRKMDELAILEAIPGAMQSGRAHRPAQLYRLKQRYRRTLSTTDRGLNPD